MNRWVDEKVFRFNVPVNNVVVMAPGNCFHKLVHIMLHLQQAAKHCSKAIKVNMKHPRRFLLQNCCTAVTVSTQTLRLTLSAPVGL